MILSELTTGILKNFSSINSGIVLKPGQNQTTWCSNHAIYAMAWFAESIPVECGIFDLRTLTQALSAFDIVPDVQFGEKAVIVKSGVQKIKYVYCNPVVIDQQYKRYTDLKFDDEAATIFSISKEDFIRLRKVASFMSLPNVVVQYDGDQLQFVATDVGSSSSNQTVITIDQAQIRTTPGAPFCFAFEAERLHKLCESGYTVHIVDGARKYGRFVHTEFPLTYTIAASAEKNLVPILD